MYIKNGSIVLEQCLWPGAIGDSLADTCRLIRICRKILEKDPQAEFVQYILGKLSYTQFITPIGYLRHPDAPYKGSYDIDGNLIKESWREDDTSGDQYQPAYLCFNTKEKAEMRRRIVMNFARYGNGQIIHPGFATQLFNWNWGTTQTLNAQVDIFEFKWRWDDSKNWFSPTDVSSCEYLNYSVTACEQPKWLKDRTPAKLLKEKWAHYWKSEPNGDWYLEVVFQFLDMYYGGI